MATFYSDQFSKAQENPKRRIDSIYAGNVQFISDTFTVTAALAQNQEIEFGVIPAGAKVLDVLLVSTDLDTAGATLDVGYTGATDAFISGADCTGALAVRYAAATNSFVSFAADSKLVAKIMDAGADATSGTIKIVCTYILD